MLSAFGAASADNRIELPFGGPGKVSLDFNLGAKWARQSLDGSKAVYAWLGYKLELAAEEKSGQHILRFALKPPAGKSLSVDSYSVRVELANSADLHALMVPSTHRIARTIDSFDKNNVWPDIRLYNTLAQDGFKVWADTNGDSPLVVITDDKGNNAATVGWLAAERSTAMEGAIEGKSYCITMKRQTDVPFTGKVLEDAVVINTAKKPWMEADETYSRAFGDYNHRKHDPVPDWAYEPVYCTWYCYADHINQEGVLKIARKCRELGFGTILIDAGWDCNPDGGYIDWETGILGDYVARPDRFPDFPGMVKQIHDMGLKVEVWSAPFWEGKKSRSYQEETSSWHMVGAEGELHELCPKYPKTREHFRQKYAWMAKTYGIDGVWIDAADAVRGSCMAKHEHLNQQMGQAFVDCLEAARAGLKSVNPNSVTEARVLHANINTKTAFDLAQPSDAPESFEILRKASIHIRPWAYDMVVKNDPMMWPTTADAATVGKFLATDVCSGVPALSVDFLTASEENCKITKAWLGFYKAHRKTLMKGKFALFGADFGSPDMMITGIDEAVVYLHNPKTAEVVLPKQFSRIILLNCTTSDEVSLSISSVSGKRALKVYGPDWTQQTSIVSLTADGTLRVKASIPQGGAAVIERGK